MDEARLRITIEQCVRRELRQGHELPGQDHELVESGALDSMGWVSVLECLEGALSLPDLAGRLGDLPARTTRALFAALSREVSLPIGRAAVREAADAADRGDVRVLGWGRAAGTAQISVEQIEREFGLSAGRLRERAGMETVARVDPGEDEISLAMRAAEDALEKSKVEIEDIDWIVAASETFLAYPSLAAVLHSRLLARETCGALDVGGGCIGLMNCLCAARGLVAAGSARKVLVVTADVHSFWLKPGRVPGTFGALFGDGASAFVLAAHDGTEGTNVYRLADCQFGCAGAHAAALKAAFTQDGTMKLDFDGEALAHAAVSRLRKLVESIELRSGVSRQEAAYFATHQPNPRLVKLFAQQAGIPQEKIPSVVKSYGNLGASTCGFALAMALDRVHEAQPGHRGPIFLAAVGPGLLWGSGLLRTSGE